jgi:hypothetical protein
MKLASTLLLLPVTLSLLLAPGCASDESKPDAAAAGDEDDLTSNSALSRTVSFEGVVYVSPNASDYEIDAAVNAQCKTGFGPLRNAKAVPNTRELKNADPSTYKKTEVDVVDTENEGAIVKKLRVSYRFNDVAVVDKSYKYRSSLPLAVLGQNAQAQADRVYTECTDGSEHTREYPLWYEFDPSRSSCRSAIQKEQSGIESARQKLTDRQTQVSKREAERLYLPITVQLGPDKTNQGKSYPEYQRLFSGGVEADKLVIGLVNGTIDDGDGDITDDSGYGDWTDELEALVEAHPFQLVTTDPPSDLSAFTTTSGKTLTNPTLRDIVDLNQGHLAGFSYSEQKELKQLVGAKITRRWLSLEAPVRIQIGDGETKDFTFKVQTYFGADSSASVYKHAIKTSDVFIYNGHSYIGSGPLDPSRFTAADFPASYQILFIDGCVSYNYYEKDYIPLKEGGTANLDLITNGIEAPAWQSGYALGQFMTALLSGNQPSYRDLLHAAEATDSLRVVDGEVDNVYSPEKQPIVVSERLADASRETKNATRNADLSVRVSFFRLARSGRPRPGRFGPPRSPTRTGWQFCYCPRRAVLVRSVSGGSRFRFSCPPRVPATHVRHAVR